MVAAGKLTIEEGAVAEAAGVDDLRYRHIGRLEQHLGMHEPVFQNEVAWRDFREFTHLAVELRPADGEVTGQLIGRVAIVAEVLTQDVNGLIDKFLIFLIQAQTVKALGIGHGRLGEISHALGVEDGVVDYGYEILGREGALQNRIHAHGQHSGKRFPLSLVADTDDGDEFRQWISPQTGNEAVVVRQLTDDQVSLQGT